MINSSKSGIDLSFEPSLQKKGEFIVFDVEATGMIPDKFSTHDNPSEMPRVIQISWILFDREGKQLSSHNRYITQYKPIPPDSVMIHGISDDTASERGELPERVWKDFIHDLDNSSYIVAHNIDYDVPVIEAELNILGIFNPFAGKKKICTMTLGKDICRIPDTNGVGYCYPSLEELYKSCFGCNASGCELQGLHDACFDTIITAKILFYLLHANKIILQDAVAEPFKLNTKRHFDGTRIKKRDFFNKIILPTLITILLFILTIFLIIIPRFKSNVMDDKRSMIKELTNSAWSVLEKLESDERKGLLSRAEAQKLAIEQIKYLRYGEDNKDYFWITDMHPNMVMHPYRSDLQGKNLDQFSDPHGKKLFVEFVDVVKANNHGYVDYMWQWKDDSKQIVPKLSYVKGFKPWGWIVGTGIYIEDVKREIRSLTHSLVLISLFISLIMVLLLALIMQQSLKIEDARGDAEHKLLDSMEKYKTLVQATTEGLIMMIDNKITFSNPRIQQLTGYNNEEISGRSFLFMLDDTNAPEIVNLFKEDEIADGQFEVILKTKEDKIKEVLLTVSTISISDKTGKILVIKDTTPKGDGSLKIDDCQQLISNYNLGFIRLQLDAKARILYANDTTARILGYSDVAELNGLFFLALFANPEKAKHFKNSLIQEGNIRENSLPLRRKDGSEVIVSLSLMVINESERILCEGIIEDVTLKERQNREAEALIAEMKTAALFAEQPIAGYVRQLFSVSMNDTVNRAERIMSAKKTDILSVISDKNEHIGIITFSDIRERVIYKGLSPEAKVFEVMSSPVISSDNHSSINDVILLTSKNNIDHVLVKQGEDNKFGVLHTKDIPGAFQQTQLYIENQIKSAGSTDELISLFSKVIQIAKPLIDQNIQARSTGQLIGGISGKITSRIIELVIEDIGAPPVDFAFIALGSEGRLEQTLETDQDNALIFRDVPEKDQLYVHNYFSRLSHKVCDSLHEVGFNYCKGMFMAKNPRWCMPLQTWKNYFNGWIETPDPQNIMDISIFFDFRPVYGNFDLANDLRRHVSSVIQDKQAFFYNFAENVINFKTAVGFTGNIITEKRENRELFDLKYAITPIVMFARIYALFKNINKTNTVDRLTILNAEKVITHNDFHETLFGYNFLMQLRYKHQINMANANLPPDNLIDIRELTDIENAIIKKVFSSVSRLQTMLSIDFKKTIS